MSSHREAPLISKDPVADSTDVYAFVSPENDGTVTIIANYVPLQDPDGGPNFAEFGDDVLYEIHIDNTGSGKPSITYQFNFQIPKQNTSNFLYNTGPITSLTDPNWMRPQTYTVTKVQGGSSTRLSPTGGGTLYCPPCNVGIRSTPNYGALADMATYRLSSGEMVYAGQRAEGFFVDLGAIFDLGDLRPLSPDHLIPGTAMAGINSLSDKNVHSIALKIPISSLTSTGTMPSGPGDPTAVIGVYTTASRQASRVYNSDGKGAVLDTGGFVQVSRLGSPLVNEVVVPMALKDYFNSQPPANDSQFAAAVEHPALQGLLPVLYPGAFPNLVAYTKPRVDLVAIFATGIPGAVIGAPFGAGTYQGGKVIAEMLRLNMGIAATGSGGTGTSNLGLLGGDLAGFPNGRRVTDDVVTIELKAVAGATIPLVDKTFTPDKAVALVSQGVTATPRAYKAAFPYLADPHGGFNNPPSTPAFDPNPEL
ncbi:MAG: DUF4331 domain-containing protein [Acidimicrobiales bacterium]